MKRTPKPVMVKLKLTKDEAKVVRFFPHHGMKLLNAIEGSARIAASTMRSLRGGRKGGAMTEKFKRRDFVGVMERARKRALDDAARIRTKFWDDFDRALAPSVCSKEAYLAALDELFSDVETRIECVRDELLAERSD